MLRKALRPVFKPTPCQRFKFNEKPEHSFNYARYPYGQTPVPIIGMWKLDHAYDYGSDQFDYEDHSMTMLHHRPSHWRSFWVIFLATCGLTQFYYNSLEMPYTGVLFGSYLLDIDDNAVKYANNDEDYHDWEGLKKQLKEARAKLEEEEEEGDEEDEEEEEAADEAQSDSEDESDTSEESSEESEEGSDESSDE
jgi:hypothetical protein